MKVFTSVKELRAELDRTEQSGIGFVPTMGALHAGHRSLVERARRENATVVVSVFVNPTQFNDKNDLRHYPRTPEADRRLLEEAGADFVLMPSVEEIYPEEDTRIFDFGQIDNYHFVCHDFGGCGCHVHNIHQTSAVQDRASVCNTFDLFQFMCD